MLADRMKNLTPYVPGEQPQDRKYIKLNTNENPFPPSPEISDHLKAYDLENLRLYSDPNSTKLCSIIAEKYGISKDQVITGNGSDEILSFCFYAFFDSNKGDLLFPEFSYSFYPVYCDFYQIQYRKIPLDNDYSINLNNYNENSCGVIFPNPNAPTGILISIEKIRDFLDSYPKNKVVVIDEAYIDFGGESCVSLINEYKNIVVTRTFSKSFSLAGLRLGFAMGDKDLISALYAVKDSFNSYPVDALAQNIGEIALKDSKYYDKITEKIVRIRDNFSSKLEESGWKVLPSSANFIFAEKKGMSGEEVYKSMKDNGILVRYFNINGLEKFVRITIGTEEEMDLFLNIDAEL
ncbi:MAG: histidinol-phosphate transaminase [Desulfobacterales bacterium]|nr:histidinol-phosphate transaminase [Desulfobacterales bacterium]MCP4161761.1 histidinol-phosphate transaminase [Deltaproteobacteria bacterium]